LANLITIRISLLQYSQDEKLDQGRGCWEVHGKPPLYYIKILYILFSNILYLKLKALSRNMCKNFIYKKLLVKTRSLENVVRLYLNFIVDFL